MCLEERDSRRSLGEGTAGRERRRERPPAPVSGSRPARQAPKPPRAVRLKLAAPWLTRTADWLKTWKAWRMSWAL